MYFCYVIFLIRNYKFLHQIVFLHKVEVLDVTHHFSNDFSVNVMIFRLRQHFSNIAYFNYLLQHFSKRYLFPNPKINFIRISSCHFKIHTRLLITIFLIVKANKALLEAKRITQRSESMSLL